MIDPQTFENQFKTFQSKSDNRFLVNWEYRYPCLNDNSTDTGFDAHYIYHPAWAARVVQEINPKMHVDISSSLSFATMLSAFIPVTFYDYRPAELTLSNLYSKKADLNKLHFSDASIESLSCMHVVEHIGLGRYGDPIDPDGDLKSIKELIRVLAVGGDLLFVTPVGKPMVRFNAHRIYSYDQIAEYFSSLSMVQFSLVDDYGKFHLNADPKYANQQNYGCGCWWFKKS